MATATVTEVPQMPAPLPPRRGGRPSAARLQLEKDYQEQLRRYQLHNGMIPTEDDPDDSEIDLAPANEVPAGPEPLPGRPSGDDFIWLTTFTQEEWERTILYLYRVEPKINRRSGSRPINIGKYSEVIDADRVMREHGSGVYQISVNRKVANGGHYDRIGLFTFEVINMAYPPRVPAGDWVEDPINKDWEWARQAIERTTAATVAAAAAPPGMTDPNTLMRTVMDTWKELESRRPAPSDSGMSQVLVAILNNQNKANDPETLVKLAALLAPKQDNTLVQMLIAQNQRLEQTVDKLTQTVMNRPEPKGIVDQLGELLPAVDTIRKVFGKGGSAAAAAESPWLAIAEKAVDALPHLAPLLMARATPSPFTPPAPPPTQPVQVQASTAATPPPAASPAASGVTSSSNAPHAAGRSQAEIQAIAQRLGPVIGKWASVLTDCTSVMEHTFRTQTGYDFRDWFIERYTVEKWREFRQDSGTQVILDMASLDANVSARFSPVSEFAAYLDAFFTEPGKEPAEVFEDPTDALEELVAAPNGAN